MERFENCLYREVCDYEEPCRNACVRYSVTKYMLEHSNIPKSKWGIHKLVPDECDVKAFENLAYIRDNIVEFTDNGHSLYIYSDTCGNGKTTWATKLVLQYFNDVWEHTGYNARGVFINVPTFLYQCKSNISRPTAEFEELRDSLFKVDLVVWDDIAAAKISDYDFSTILSILDSRVYKQKANIYTSNISPQNIENYVGAKLASRIAKGITIQLRGGDKRNGSTASSHFENLSV